MYKFISWNVNGLRAVCGKGFADIFADLDADFFCLQETKLSVDTEHPELPGYQVWYLDENGMVSESYRNTLDFMEKKLSDYGFIRCHERCLVNYRKIYTINSGNCILFSGEKIPISRSRMEKTKEYYQSYIRSMD